MKQRAEFSKKLTEFWLADARDSQSAPLLLQYLRSPKATLSEAEFKWMLADAILNKRFSAVEYENLTEMDVETSEDVAADLSHLWRLMFGEEPIVLPMRPG